MSWTETILALVMSAATGHGWVPDVRWSAPERFQARLVGHQAVPTS